MTALARLCALCHLDLNFSRAVQVRVGDAEASGSHLLDRRIFLGSISGRILTALTGVRLAAQPVHRDGHGLVRFLRNRSEGHGTGLEALHNAFHRLYLLQRNRILLRREFQQSTQGMRSLGIIHHIGVFTELVVVAGFYRLLQGDDSLRIIQVILLVLAASEIMEAYGIQRGIHGQSKRIKGMIVAEGNALFDLFDADAAHAAHCSGEVFVDGLLVQTDRLKNTRGLVGLNRRDTHLRSRLYNSAEKGLVVIGNRSVIVLVQHADIDQLRDALMSQIRIDGTGTESKQRRDLMNVSRLRTLQDQRNGRSLLRADQMLLDRRYREKRRNRNMVLIHATVAENDDIFSVCIGTVYRNVQLLQRSRKGGVLVIQKGNHLCVEARAIQRLDLHQVDAGQNRMANLQHRAVAALLIQKIAVRSDIYGGIRDDFLAERVNRRVGNLRKLLLEVVEQKLVLSGQYRKRNIVSHRSGRLNAVFRHWKDRILDVLIGIAEYLIEAVSHLLAVYRDLLVRNRNVLESQQVAVQPLTVRLPVSIVLLAVVIGDDFLLLRVDQKNSSGRQAGFLHHVFRRNIQNSHLRGEDQPVVIGDVIPGRTQSVPVKGRTEHISVGKQNCRRAVPRLHHGRIVMVEILLILVHETIVVPRLRNGHHHGKRKIHAVHVEEFQRVVQHRRIGTRRADHRINLVDVLLHDRAGHGLLTGEHTVHVAADRIDLSVVRNHAVRMRAVPGRSRVCGEPGVHNCNRRPVILVLEIAVEPSQLFDQEHSLVYDGSR